jgi:hypothetical protein
MLKCYFAVTAIFHSINWMSTSTAALLGSETGGKQWIQEPFLAVVMALLMIST